MAQSLTYIPVAYGDMTQPLFKENVDKLLQVQAAFSAPSELRSQTISVTAGALCIKLSTWLFQHDTSITALTEPVDGVSVQTIRETYKFLHTIALEGQHAVFDIAAN